jgi:hypothetical protein
VAVWHGIRQHWVGARSVAAPAVESAALAAEMSDYVGCLGGGIGSCVIGFRMIIFSDDSAVASDLMVAQHQQPKEKRRFI